MPLIVDLILRLHSNVYRAYANTTNTHLMVALAHYRQEGYSPYDFACDMSRHGFDGNEALEAATVVLTLVN